MTVVYYSQEDKRWANAPYTIRNDPKQTIGTSACGPTCFAMIAASWIDPSITPPETAKWAVYNGFRTANSGTAWTYFEAAAKHYGLACKQTGSLSEAKQALAAGALVIASMGPGHMTGGGHYVLLVGISGKWVEVFDPNHDNTKYGADGLIKQGVKNDGKIEADESVFKREARQYWIFPKTVKEEAKSVEKVPLTKFPDVKAGHWAESSIKAASDAGIMKGLPDGTFAPDKPVTRAEMAVIVAKLIK